LLSALALGSGCQKAARDSSRNEAQSVREATMDYAPEAAAKVYDEASSLLGDSLRTQGYDSYRGEPGLPPPNDSALAGVTTTTPSQSRRLVVYSALLRLSVEAIQSSLLRAEQLVTALGGHVESSSLQHRVLRVPSERYEEALSALKELGTILELTQTSEDVTEAFSDVVRRIENLRALEARYLLLLADAKDIPTRLAVERELRRISAQLRELEEQRRVLADRIALATITLELELKPKTVTISKSRVQPFAFIDDYGLSAVLQ